MITKKSTLDMTHEQWLEERKLGIGGSDAATVMGMNEYTSPYALWQEKTSLVIPDSIDDKEAVRLGRDLEEYVAQRFCEASGKKVRRDNHIIRNSEYPWALANIDRAIVGEQAGLECKTTSSYDYIKLLQDGKIPAYWHYQMLHYMTITGCNHWYLAALGFGRGFYWMEAQYDEQEAELLMDKEKEFWELVQAKEAPEIDGTDSTTEAIKKLYPESDDTKIDLTPMSVNLDIIKGLGEQIKDLENKKAAYENEIKNYMGTASGGAYGNYSISYSSYERSTFQKKEFEKDFGAIPDKYFKTSTVRPFKLTIKN